MFYRSKPVLVNAIQYTGENGYEVVEHAQTEVRRPGGETEPLVAEYEGGKLSCFTKNGAIQAHPGDFIICRTDECYPCPASVFAEKYEKAEPRPPTPGGFDFAEALHWLREGRKVQRAGWNGKNLWAALVDCRHWGMDSNNAYDTGKVGNGLRSFLGLKDAQEKFGPWVPSTSDLLANDWQVVE